jgi:hypothetical protein
MDFVKKSNKGRKKKTDITLNADTTTTKAKKKYDVYTEKQFGLAQEETTNSIQQESLILHLSIPVGEKINDIVEKSETIESNFFEYSPNMDVPEPYDKDDNFSFLLQTPLEKNNEFEYVPQTQIDVINDKLCFISNGQTVITKKSYKNMQNIEPLNDLCCWWCCHPFDWHAVMLPINKSKNNTESNLKKEDNFTVIGNFCSPECCVSYNFQCGSKYGDIWKQYGWLHEVYSRQISSVSNIPVKFKQAPPRESLSIFGGPYTISDFRKMNDNYFTDVIHVIPPLYPSNGYTEEVLVEYVNTKKFVPMDKDRIAKATEELKLKRNKKKNTDNTLEKFMNLKISQ